ncbi:MAG: DUF6125 family protein [Candidatus Hermodarchaeota archaeon]
MTIFEQLDKNQLKEILVKCWMTHDGAWFYNCYNELGIELANKLNKAAIKNLSLIEVQRVRKAMGMESRPINTFEQLKAFINNAFSILKGDFMNFIYSFPKENCMHWEMNRCFAHEGMKRFGIPNLYECGIVYRVSCWLDVLGIKHEINPKFKKCLLYSQERCSGDFIINSFKNS